MLDFDKWVGCLREEVQSAVNWDRMRDASSIMDSRFFNSIFTHSTALKASFSLHVFATFGTLLFLSRVEWSLKCDYCKMWKIILSFCLIISNRKILFYMQDIDITRLDEYKHHWVYLKNRIFSFLGWTILSFSFVLQFFVHFKSNKKITTEFLFIRKRKKKNQNEKTFDYQETVLTHIYKHTLKYK